MRSERDASTLAGWRAGMLLAGLLVLGASYPISGWSAAKTERALVYTNEVIPSVPLSIHVVRVDRSQADLRFCTTLGGGQVLGMGIVTDQLKSLPPELGTPVAAINGDFYEKAKDYPGRPRDLQIRHGEVISHPAGHSCFWIDPRGNPQMTNVFSRFRVVWPDGVETPLGLNVSRTNDAAVLYTAVTGPSTLSRGGIDYVLERGAEGPWLPLRVGATYTARVRQVQAAGNAPLDRETLVLSVGPGLAARIPRLETGAAVRLILETVPDLTGVEVAISGGPALIKNRQILSWKDFVQMRHPRSAIGWNQQYIYLVQVDGRQIDVSLGMTFQEVAEYMLKLGCEEALNFDGGGSSTLWALGTVRNSPSEGQERPAPNALVVVKKNSHSPGK